MGRPRKNMNKLNSPELDKNSIFGLFEEVPTKQISEVKKKLVNIKDSPTYKLGMFTKIILNHFVFHDKLQKFLKKEEPSYNVESTREASEFVIFNRAYSYIKKVNVSDKESIYAILDFNPKLLSSSLDSALNYFESLEEYEKCACIFKIKKILKESLK
jgi:hypothetical protein